ncbi:METTL22 [Lepeophtheirus salmonis]|uniref:METTL22 n=1 Tax=Lepeophtheirus salmonis TaxID=72036 RepID=A0A7R8H2C3_LEPSM|nr:METTL22 [Lepeophtheirus salmonis]CAF2811361.1 METTL22 [Lepeophtheirus salmonis]
MDHYTSEIHGTLNSKKGSDGTYIARIRVSKPCSISSDGRSSTAKMLFDEDGDLIRSTEEESVILLKHSGSSSLQDVGSQLWGGSLLLADMILAHPEFLLQGNVLEIGSGTGLTPIGAAICLPSTSFSSYIVTDLEQNLDGIRHNFALNHFPKWAQETDVVLGGDVIYDEVLTNGIIAFILSLKEGAVLYFAIEKRYVFTNEDLDIVSHSYNYFLQGLNHHGIPFEEMDPLPTQSFCYERSRDLILLRIMKQKR